MKKLFFLSIFILLISACTRSPVGDKAMEQSYNNIREPAVAGQFYPGDEAHLDFKIKQNLDRVGEEKFAGQLKAIMVPHAGYDYSAPVAAYTYKLLEGKRPDTVVIISNSHAAYFPGIAIDQNDAWRTPLGLVPVNKVLVSTRIAIATSC